MDEVMIHLLGINCYGQLRRIVRKLVLQVNPVTIFGHTWQKVSLLNHGCGLLASIIHFSYCRNKTIRK
jgi:hypothetical protein